LRVLLGSYITSLIYIAAVADTLNQKNIDKLILMATPVDFSKDNTTVSMWSKSTDPNKIIKTFDHFDGYFSVVGIMTTILLQ
jgi:hypothetical protein